MKLVFLTALVFFLSLNVFAKDPFFSKNKYKTQDFEMECLVTQSVFPEARSYPFCPAIYQYDYSAESDLNTVKANVMNMIKYNLIESDFTSSESALIADMQQRQYEGITINFSAQYDQLLKNIYGSLKDAVVWTSPDVGYLVLVSPKDNMLYVIQSGGIQEAQ